jgi:2,5-dihydroxypyridine 5,6-dioxygenase
MKKASVADLIPLFKQEFELCKVEEGEVVGLLTDPTTWPEYIEAASGAAQALGASAFEVKVPSLGWDVPTPVRGMGASVPVLAHESPLLEAVRAALAKSTFVVDLVRETIIHAPLRDELRNAGARILTIMEPPDVLERMVPTPEITERVKAITDRIANAHELKATSDAGTEVVYGLTPKTPLMQYGYAEVAGRWDHWPSALAVAYPVDGTAQGTVVLQPGDILFPFKQYVQSEVTLTLEDGYITSLEGGQDALLIKDYLDSWSEPEVFAASHIGFGMHPRAQWSALPFFEKDEMIGMDGRCFLGNFLFSTGPNRFTGRLVEAHLDIPMRGCSVSIDDEQLIDRGVMLEAVVKAAG